VHKNAHKKEPGQASYKPTIYDFRVFRTVYTALRCKWAGCCLSFCVARSEVFLTPDVGPGPGGLGEPNPKLLAATVVSNHTLFVQLAEVEEKGPFALGFCGLKTAYCRFVCQPFTGARCAV
jgi:hypothetical protein